MTHPVANFSVERNKGGRFLPGSGGRPKGAKNKSSRALLEQVKDLGPLAFDKLQQAVTDGHKWAVEYVLGRILPTERTIAFEGVEPEDIQSALRDGDITTAEAKDIATALAKLSEIENIAAIRARLDELEKRSAV